MKNSKVVLEMEENEITVFEKKNSLFGRNNSLSENHDFINNKSLRTKNRRKVIIILENINQNLKNMTVKQHHRIAR